MTILLTTEDSARTTALRARPPQRGGVLAHCCGIHIQAVVTDANTARYLQTRDT
jgi:hypothetical protein